MVTMQGLEGIQLGCFGVDWVNVISLVSALEVVH